MSTIQFSNGTKVNFNGNPTPQDVEEVARRLGISAPQASSESKVVTGSAGQHIIKGSDFMSNLKRFPGEVLSFAQSILPGTKQAGQDIAAGIGANAAADRQQQLVAQDTHNISSIVERIDQARKNGQDTTHLVNLLKSYRPANDPNKTLQDMFPSLARSNEQIIGDFASVAANILTAGSLETGASAAVKPASGAIKGFIQGLKSGAIGGATAGGAQGLTFGLRENYSPAGVAASTVAGAGAGGVVGGLAGGASGALAGRRVAQQSAEHDFALQLTSPKLTTKQSAEAIAQGRYKSPGIFSPAELKPSAHDELVAHSVEGIVSPKASVTKNVAAIDTAIGDINSGVRAMIQERKVPFNTAQLRTQLMSGKQDLQLVFASDQTAEKTYDKAVQSFMDYVKGKDTLGLFEARQSWDKTPAVKKLLNSSALGENTRKEVVLAVRRSANEYIASLLPKNNPYRAALLRESRMIEALGNIGAKNASSLGKNKLELLTQKHPILKWVVGGTATGLVGAAGVGVGGAIINSTN